MTKITKKAQEAIARMVYWNERFQEDVKSWTNAINAETYDILAAAAAEEAAYFSASTAVKYANKAGIDADSVISRANHFVEMINNERAAA